MMEMSTYKQVRSIWSHSVVHRFDGDTKFLVVIHISVRIVKYNKYPSDWVFISISFSYRFLCFNSSEFEFDPDILRVYTELSSAS